MKGWGVVGSDGRSRFKTGLNRDLDNITRIVSQIEEKCFFELKLFPKCIFFIFRGISDNMILLMIYCSQSMIQQGFSMDYHRLPRDPTEKKRKFHFFQTLYDDINFCAVLKCFGGLKGMLRGLQKRQ